LFYPPNVAGWPNGKEWIDSSSLIFRTNLGKKIIDSSELNVLPKPDDDRNPNEMLKKEKRFEMIEAKINWGDIAAEINEHNDKKLVEKMGVYLLQTDMNRALADKIDLTAGTTEQKLARICAMITAMPEYQLC
jgi:Protein of unknown function (DUF1800)